MTSDDYKAELAALILKPPRPDSIGTVQTARAFKDAAKKAQRAGNKSLAQLQQIFNNLKGFY